MSAWVGGGNNNAENPEDWSPIGVPPPGESLTMNSGTMNIDDYDLGNNPAFPGDLTHQYGLLINGNVTLDLADAIVLPAIFSGHATVNLRDTDNLFLQISPSPSENASATVDLAALARWVGEFNASGDASLTVTGGPFAQFITSGDLDSSFHGVAAGAHAIIDTTITGDGLIRDFDSTLEIGGVVKQGTTIGVNSDATPRNGSGGTLVIDHPQEFFGQVQWTKVQSTSTVWLMPTATAIQMIFWPFGHVDKSSTA